MKPLQDTYPVFEANQVLSDLQLNLVTAFSNEQERLTRTNLIGIGIACGMTLRYEAAGPTVHVGRGCGVCSAGYLIVEPDDVALVAYRDYTLAPEPDYAPFRDQGAALHPQYPLWELFPAGEPDATPLATPAGFLDDKAVVLFYELKQEGLRNCSPNDCNDRGAQVSVTVRRLLIRVGDLGEIIAAAGALGGGLSGADLEAALGARLNLPDLRLPRFDVPNTGPATSEQVLAAFHAVFRRGGLAAKTGNALSAAYTAFRPLLRAHFPDDPFSGFAARFGFLDHAPETREQVVFLQYYLDFFDDLIRAYDEFRWTATELLCACCPPEHLFPRHLLLGVLLPATVGDPALYRQRFVPACTGDALATQVLQLFQRLAEMATRFTDAPPLPAPVPDTRLDPQLRITPSADARQPLANMAIPYYYRFDATEPLYRCWSPERSARRRAHHNLGYRSDEYAPPAPDFVRDALGYDLAPYSFLRIEGHLGKEGGAVLETLLALKTRYRLPIDVIAVRTGGFDESVPLAPGEGARFDDLEALYDTWREELLNVLAEGVRFLYGVPIGVALPGAAPRLPLLARRAQGLVAAADSVGAWYEKNLNLFLARPYIDVDQTKIDADAVMLVYCTLFTGTSPPLPPEFYAHAVSVYYLSKLAEALPDSLEALAFADFDNKCQDLLGLTRYFRGEASKTMGADLAQFAPVEALIDHFDHVLYSCPLEPMRALHGEYLRRVRELKQGQLLATFLDRHPGVQHKAGVPLGGTFILVCHGAPVAAPSFEVKERLPLIAAAARVDAAPMLEAINRIGGRPELAHDPDLRFLFGALTGMAPNPDLAAPPAVGDAAQAAIGDAVGHLRAGAVIADLFLPYLCSATGPGVQYVLPRPPLGLRISFACTDPSDHAEATLVAAGGLGPFTYQLDGQPFQPLARPVRMGAGAHTVVLRDSAGTESARQAVSVPAALRFGTETYADDAAALTYQVKFAVDGGTPPYAASSGTITGNSYASAAVPSGAPIRVEISDSAGCKASREFTHAVAPPCELPCDGFARRCGYRFWLPEPDPERPYEGTAMAEAIAFRFEFPAGNMIDLTSAIGPILHAGAADLNGNFDDVALGWVKQINRQIADAIDTPDGLFLVYERPALGMATLWIERFECLTFEFHVQTFFRRGGVGQSLELVHGPEGTTFVQPGHDPVSIPPFNCKRIAKCDPARPLTELCRDVDLALEISKGLADGITLSVAARGADVSPDVPPVFLWEVADCSPVFSGGERASFQIVQREPLIKPIRLSAFAKGCMVVLVDQINIG